MASTASATSFAPLQRGHLRVFAQFDVTVNIFDHHHGIVDQARKRQRQPAQDHAVDGSYRPMCRMKKVIITESGMERNTAAVARKLPRKIRIMTAGEKQSDAAFAQHRGDSLLHEKRIGRKRHASCSCAGMSRSVSDGLPDAVDDGDGVGVPALLLNRHVHGFLAIHADDVVLHGRSRPRPCPRRK